MAEVYRTGRVLIVNGVMVDAGTLVTVANAEVNWGNNLNAYLADNTLVHTFTDVIQTNATSQTIPYSGYELAWDKVQTGPSKIPTATVDESSPAVWSNECDIDGHGAVTAVANIRLPGVATLSGHGFAAGVGTSS